VGLCGIFSGAYENSLEGALPTELGLWTINNYL
jgi:hypothetical protein